MGDAIARERAIRERVWAAYCQPREAFGTLEEWNNYLEEREDVAFSLVEGVDVARAEARLRAYTAENADSIAKHQAQRAEEEAGDEARRMSYRMASQGGREQPGGGGACRGRTRRRWPSRGPPHPGRRSDGRCLRPWPGAGGRRWRSSGACKKRE